MSIDPMSVAKVNTEHLQYRTALERWRRCRDVHAGEDAVKAGGQLYLPSRDWNDGSRDRRYRAYLQRTSFYNATARTVGGLLGAMFRKGLGVHVPPTVQADLADVSLGHATSLLDFAMQAALEILLVGRAGALVDFHTDDDPLLSRPYWVLFYAESIVNWREELLPGKGRRLTLVVLRETVSTVDPKNRFAVQPRVQYRVLELIDGVYTVTIWKRQGDGDAVVRQGDVYAPDVPMVPHRRGAPLDFIPFTFVGASSLDPEIERPPLLDLVDVNLAHYRNSANLEHGLFCTAAPTPWIAGLKTNGDTIALGASAVLLIEDPAGKAGMLEFSGAGLASIAAAMAEKEKHMATLGARLLEAQPSVGETATAVQLRHSGDAASLKTISTTLGHALTRLARWHAFWRGLEERPEDVVIAPSTDFFGLDLSADEVKALLALLQAGTISYETFYDRLQRGEWVRPEVSVQQERADINAEGGAGAAGSLPQ